MTGHWGWPGRLCALVQVGAEGCTVETKWLHWPPAWCSEVQQVTLGISKLQQVALERTKVAGGMHLAGEAWVVGALSTFQQITKFHKKESKLWHPHTQKLMPVEFKQITINRSLKVFSFVFVVVLILSFVSGFHFYPWWRKVSGRHTSCVPRLESRTFRRELLSCTQKTFTFSQIFQNSSFQQTWSSST